MSVWQARILTAHLLGRDEEFGGYEAMAWATFTDPEIGRVGLTEQEARDAGLTRARRRPAAVVEHAAAGSTAPATTASSRWSRTPTAACSSAPRSCGPYGGELIGMLTLAVHAEVPVATLRTMHYVFPTLHRAVLEAVSALA